MSAEGNKFRGVPKPGDMLAGKYRVDRVLGAGGMGVVVAATHLELEQKVAIKFLLAEGLMHPTKIERFKREAKAAALASGHNGDFAAKPIDDEAAAIILSTWLNEQ